MKYSEKMDCFKISKVIKQFEVDSEAFIRSEENAFHKKLTDLCDQIIQKKINIVLLTGPSASGKTTTAKRLVSELQLRGMKSDRISLDNFYRDNDVDPLWGDGQINFEDIRSLDVECFHQKLNELFQHGGADFPVFDFTVGKRSKNVFSVSFDQNTCLVFEGIHALNPLLCGHILESHTMRIYVSVHSNFVNDEGETVLSAQQLRFLRRLLRDSKHRNNSAGETLKMWDHVLEGERLYIHPFRKNADVHINSAHGYEPFLYRDRAVELLKPMMDCPEHLHLVGSLMGIETVFPALSPERVPKASLLQEFI